MRRILLHFLLSATLLFGSAMPAAHAASSALLIGVEKYDQPRLSAFPGANNDVTQLAAALGESGVFAPVNVEVLPSATGAATTSASSPTRDEILTRLNALAQNTGANDTVLLFFAGQSVFNGEATYLLTKESDPTSQDTLRGTAISAGDLSAALGKLAVRHLILLFDVNRVAFPAAPQSATRNSLTTRQLRDLAIDPPLTTDSLALFSCSARERGWDVESERKKTDTSRNANPFTSALISGLRGAAADEKGEVLAGQLAEYVRKRVFVELMEARGTMQSPCLVMPEGEAIAALLARGKAPGTAGATALPAEADNSTDGRFAAALERGYELYQDRRFVGARTKFDEALRYNPRSAQAEFMMGLVDNEGYRDSISAETHWRRAMVLDPAWTRPMLELAALLGEKKNDVAGAEAFLRQIIPASESGTAALIAQARLLQRAKKDPTGAEKLYRQALENDANNAAALSGLGEVLFEQGRFDAAIHVLDFAGTLEPDRPGLLLQQAACQLKLERREEAKKTAQRALTLGYRGDSSLFKELELPAPPAAWDIRPESVYDVPGLLREGETLLAHGRFRLAQLKFEQVLESQPASARAITMLGVLAQLYLKSPSEAETLYRKACEIDAKAAEPRFRLGTLLVLARDYKAAEPLFVKAMELAPTDSRPVTSLGEIFYQRFDYDRAAELFRKAMELDPANPLPVNNLAILALNAKSDIKQAEKLFRRAMELDPNSALAASNLATLQMNRIGDYAEAEKLLRRAIELEPGEGFYYANLAFCLFQLKHRPEAEAAAARARELGYKDDHPIYALLKAKPAKP